MPATDTNLFLCTECDKPIPAPPLERKYRVYVPLLDLVGGDGETRVTAPETPISVSKWGGPSAANMERASDVFGGIPLNAYAATIDQRWSEPVFKEISVRDAAKLVRTMTVQGPDGDVALDVTSAAVNDLLDSGRALVRRLRGGFVRLRLADDAPRPAIHHVTDLQSFILAPVAVLPDGGRRAVRLSSANLSKLAGGIPVVSGGGPSAMIIMPRIAAIVTQTTSGGGLTGPSTRPSETDTGDTQTTTPDPTDTQPQTQAPPTNHQRPGLAVLLPMDQDWVLKTYERGRLISSISLTPQEEVTIEVFSWDRRKSSREDSTSYDSETNADAQSVDRDTRDVFSELTKSGNFSWGLNGSFSGFGANVGANIGNANSIANVARTTRQMVQEQTIKASEKVKASRQTKITESTETGSETRITRKLRNSNLCNAVTYNYFELAARYDVTTACVKDEAVFALLVDNPLARPSFSIDYIRTYESVFRRALLDPAVGAGFDAARTLWMLNRASAVICNPCPCPGDAVGSADAASFPAARAAVSQLAMAVSVLRSNAAAFDWTPLFLTLAPIPNQLPPTPPMANDPRSREFLFVEALNYVAPDLLATLSTISAPFMNSGPSAAQLTTFSTQFATLDLTKFDAALTPDEDTKTHLHAAIEAMIRSTYHGMAKATFDALVANNGTGNVIIDGFIQGVSSAVTTENAAMGVVVGAILSALDLSPGFGSTTAHGVKQLAQTTATDLAAWAGAAKQSDDAAAQARKDHQTAFATLFPAATILTAQERFDALVKHLSAYSDYYAYAVISDLISRNQFPPPMALLPYLAFVSPLPMAVVAGRLAYAIDLATSSLFSGALGALKAIIAAIPDETSTGEVTLPTPGFVVEPKLSCCSACEDFVESSREIELDLRRAQLEQARREADRRAALLALTPADLTPFDPTEPGLRIDLQQTKAPGP